MLSRHFLCWVNALLPFAPFVSASSPAAQPPAERKFARASLEEAPVAEYSFKASGPADEALIFTPPGFEKVGVPAVAEGPETTKLRITIRDRRTEQPTFCRVNVVGPDGNYYEPRESHLKIYGLTGQWPKWPKGWGNRPGKAPIRYFGRFFYCTGEATVDVPAGSVRIEVWKGFEYQPQIATTEVRAGETRAVELALTQTVPMAEYGYWSGDPHIHITRKNEADERVILDLLEAEDIHFTTALAYNEPPGTYVGLMDKMTTPQHGGLGQRSVLARGDYAVVSAQEYRSSTYGHINLFWLDRLVLESQSLDANNWPPFGHVARDARASGGIAFYAHGGYAQEIYADVVQGNVDGVELLQFGVYRGIGLIDWYRMLNCGFRVPANGASDYPACRKLGDCKTYVYVSNAADVRRGSPDPAETADRKVSVVARSGDRPQHKMGDRSQPPTMEAWLRGMADGRSFFTTGPMLLLEVDGNKPGALIEKQSDGPHKLTARVRVRSEVAPVTDVQLVVNGRILREMKVPAGQRKGHWLEFEQQVELTESAWIAARAFSLSPLGTPDAEAHTNPVYVYVNGKAPYDRESLEGLIAQIDKQIAVHKKRNFAEKAKILAYFAHSRDILLKIRESGGAPAQGRRLDIGALPGSN
ncbi:MAG: hypothetical protein H8E44_15240 [Planctomycetes bacterium]|nr:hypothetical protein [Planctomycetota bacterium]MBL7043949.1 hypothetical protein [Pirellulaceae bacterium]